MLKKHQSGFTLVELAVVVVIIGIMATAGLAALNSQLASASISVTKKKQEAIKDALETYLVKNKRLPCPATDTTGQESRVITNTPANCTGYFGLLPYAELNLPKSMALDGWEDFFSYAVSSQWTLSYSNAAPVVGGKLTNLAANAFNVGDLGAITVNNRPLPVTTPTSSISAAFVVSHGKNGLGAFTSKGTQAVSPEAGTDELANVIVSSWAVPASFSQREYTDIDVPTYGAFDDVVLLISSNDLIAPIVKDGAFKSAEAEWADQVDKINDALISDMLKPSTLTCAPPSDQAAFNALLTANNINTIDPWGGTLSYTQLITKLNQDVVPTPPASTHPYSLSTPTAGQNTYVPSITTLYGKYQKIVNNNCPP
jgi:prepilin-type N-terminal cleavage/methylation domain-containing protein